MATVDGLTLRFELPPGAWIDLDTLVETTVAGLRDAGILRPRFAGLDAIAATKRFGTSPGVVISPTPASALAGAPPGTAVLAVRTDLVPRAGNREAKRAWRATLAQAWAGRAELAGPSWADVRLGVTGSLLGPLEVVLDALEPVLGRDPRGRDWQEFFPNDDRIQWLRVRRCPEPGLSLAMGPLGATWQ